MDSDAFDGLKRTLGMQHEGQDKVDPYVVVSFAGKKLKTNVIYNNYSPVWNQELNMGVQIPTMCEQLMLKVMDKSVFYSFVMSPGFFSFVLIINHYLILWL